MKKLIKYEKQKSRVNENRRVNVDSNSLCTNLVKERKCISQNNQRQNISYFTNNNDVFERLSRPNSKTKLCSKAVSTVGVQTDLQYIHTSKYTFPLLTSTIVQF